jgi:hypothetical protein
MDMDEATEERILETAEMTQDALAMNRALLDSDFTEARFRAKLLHHQAALIGDTPLLDAASLVVRLLGRHGTTPSLGCGAAMLALSTRLGERLG